jgi:hypothetical protein
MSYDPESSAVEVAEDFKSALEDMTTVLRVEIMNLCQIAKENTEHAFEISEVLQSHILKVRGVTLLTEKFPCFLATLLTFYQ